MLVKILLLVLLAVGAQAQKKYWRDCGKDPNRPVLIENLSFPSLLELPRGKTAVLKIPISARVNVREELPSPIKAEIKLRKRLFGHFFTIPCVKNRFGSCTYENICPLLTGELADLCPFSGQGADCQCPLSPNTYEVKDKNMLIPLNKLSGLAQVAASGRYAFQWKAWNPDTGREYWCFRMTFAVKLPPKE